MAQEFGRSPRHSTTGGASPAQGPACMITLKGRATWHNLGCPEAPSCQVALTARIVFRPQGLVMVVLGVSL